MSKESDLIAEGYAIQAGLSPEETKKAKIINKQYFEIIDHCLQGSQKLTEIIIDDLNLICFPVFSDDNLEKIVLRWAKLYPIEVKALVAQVESLKDGNEAGWSAGGLMKWNCSVPTTVYQACKALNHNYWLDVKHLKEFRALCPKLSTKSNKSNRVGA